MTEYVELHAASAFSFLNGASLPEDLVQRASELGYPAMALTDANGVYGAPRFYRAAKEAGLRPIVGADILLDGEPLTLLAASRKGYQNLCGLLTAAALGRPKGKPRVDWEDFVCRSEGLYSLCASEALLPKVLPAMPGRIYVELQRHFSRAEERHNRLLMDIAAKLRLPLAAANGVRYASPEDKDLFDVLTCIRLGKTLESAGRILESHRERYLKSAAQMAELFADLPEAIRNSAELAQKLDFTLADLGYRFPDFDLPPGETPDSFLRRLTWASAPRRFPEITPKVRAQLEKELTIIRKLKLSGYFLTIWDIVQFCKRENIMVQGRGSAANSAVCFALSITAVDPIKMDLLFERFLSEERGEWPDIDLDLPSGDQRERVIQHLYRKHGGGCSAMTANVITYRPKSAMRELAKVFGFSMQQADSLSRWVSTFEREETSFLGRGIPQNLPALPSRGPSLRTRGKASQDISLMLKLFGKMQGLPRHLGQHSGGMVISGGKLEQIVPLEPATMPGRVVVQWDKEDCADLGIIKVDLLGLGMLAVLEEAIPTIRENEGITVDLAKIPPDDPEIFKVLNKADTVGLFQLESRAQMASLPRHAPNRFYDIVVQVAIIRPGPIVGGMIRPFFDRRNGIRPVEYPHPSLEPILKRTLGVPLFQEQVLRMAMVAAGFSGGQAEELRRAIGFRRSNDRMEAIVAKLRSGMSARGVGSAAQEQIVKMITSFALYGFPESHAASFALIAYASAYLKVHHPAAFYVSILNAWPMGFYHPATLVKDAQRHGMEVLPIDVSFSGKTCRWVSPSSFRLGLRFIKGLRSEAARNIEAERVKSAFRDAGDLARRAGLRADELDRLAYAGALGSLGLSRRAALWQAAQVSQHPGPLFDGQDISGQSPLEEMSPLQKTEADYQSSALTTGPHVMEHYRADLTTRGILSASELDRRGEGEIVKTAGSVIVRQRPGTAKGFAFVTLEDESGLSQAIFSPALFQRCRTLITSSPALVIEGKLQKQPGNNSVKALRVWPLDCQPNPSHDFH